jgi:hypothetical protein
MGIFKNIHSIHHIIETMRRSAPSMDGGDNTRKRFAPRGEWATPPAQYYSSGTGAATALGGLGFQPPGMPAGNVSPVRESVRA